LALPKRDWKVMVYWCFAQAQRLGQQAAGLVALAVVGVAQVQRALGHAVKTHHQLVGLAVGLPVFAHGGGQRGDVAGVVVKVVDETAARARKRSAAGPSL
jgi:hypothetical protein